MKSLRWITAALLITVVAVSGCGRRKTPPETVISGRTMGTTYLVRVAGVSPEQAGQAGLAQAIEGRLDRINSFFSVFDERSELSRFNRAPPGKAVKVSPETSKVVAAALELAAASGGAFNPAVGPLVDVWGFGPSGRGDSPPSGTALKAALELSDYRQVTIEEGPALVKKRAGVQLNLNSLAKGYAADDLLALCAEMGWTNALVEIGGDIALSGRRADGNRWVLGIQRPADHARPGESLTARISPPAGGIATSGDYQNLFLGEDGRRYSHIIDPRTGRPVDNEVASVTVCAPSGMLADALATALFVMGPEEGIHLLQSYPGAEALFILRREDGFELRQSPGFRRRADYRD